MKRRLMRKFQGTRMTFGKLLRIKTLMLLSAFSLMACATTPKPIPFKADWEFCDFKGERWACLPLEDVLKLREKLIRGCDDK